MNTPTNKVIPAIVIATIRIGLQARQRGMYLTSPAKGGSTKKLLARLSECTGITYKSSDKGIEQAIEHCNFILNKVKEAENNGQPTADIYTRIVCQNTRMY
jgi:hypothetical protein